MSTTPTQRKGRADSVIPAKKEDEKKEDEVKKGATKSGLFTPLNIGVAVAVAVFAVCFYFFGPKVDVKGSLQKAVQFIDNQGQTAVIWYCVVVLVGVVCLVPTTPVELAGGFLFSPKYGVMGTLVFTGATKLVANTISVLIARFVLKDWVNRTLVAKYDLLKMVSIAVKEEPWKMAFLVRGSMVPLAVKNYGLGVMEIGYMPIVACSMIFTNFYAFQNIYIGSTLKNLEEVFAPKKAGGGPTDWTQKAKSLMPIAFNVLLIVFLVKAVKAQVKKQKDKIEADLKKKQTENDKTK